MDAVDSFHYVDDLYAHRPVSLFCAFMPTPTPYEKPPRATLPTPCPTEPVAGRPVDTETPAFDWTPVPEATDYRVQIGSKEDFEAVHYDEMTERGRAVPLDSVLPDDVETACWRVQAKGADDAQSEWSEPARFAVPSAELDAEAGTVRVEAPPVPLQPTSDEEPPVDQSAVPFTWEGVPEATGYRLQVAFTEDFSDPVVDLTVDHTTSVTLYDTLQEGRTSYHWRIRPLFPLAEPGPWSDPVSFPVAPAVEDEDEFASQAEDPQASARAAGPATRARTSKTLSLTVSLVAVLGFLATVALIFLVG